MASKFQRGSGCYKCNVCGRQTRATGVQSMGSELCPHCFELAGYENELSDRGVDEWPESNTRAVRTFIAEVEEKGGNAAEWHGVFASVLNPAPEPLSTAEELLIPDLEPTKSIAQTVLEGERSMRMTEYRNLVGRVAVEAADLARKLDAGRISTHDGANLGRTAADLQALAAVIESLGRAINSCTEAL